MKKTLSSCAVALVSVVALSAVVVLAGAWLQAPLVSANPGHAAARSSGRLRCLRRLYRAFLVCPARSPGRLNQA